MPSIHVLCLPGKSRLQLRRHETESMSTGHWAKNKELSSSPGLCQSIYRVSGLLGAWIREGWAMGVSKGHPEEHTQQQMRRGQAFQWECKKPRPSKFFNTREKMKVIPVRWTCGCRKVNDQIPDSLMLGEITGTKWDLCCMTQASHNYLATTCHFYAHDCLRISINCFYFSVFYFSSCQISCVIDN